MTQALDQKEEEAEQLLSVIICTHDPRRDHLQRTLEGLRAQSLELGRWELLLVDNASKEFLADTWDLSWHPKGRHVREDRLGLTMARLRGIKESGAALLLFVDDDNVLSPDYLSTLIGIVQRNPTLGVFGSGRIEPEYEVDPDPALGPYLTMLALRVVGAPHWSNDPSDLHVPWGAGMAVRRDVAERYQAIVLTDPMKQRLDRTGSELNSCGDDEFSWVSCEMGFGKGIFPELLVKHLIGRPRIQLDYLLKLAEGHAFSRAMLIHLHNGVVPRPSRIPTWRDVLRHSVQLQTGKALLALTNIRQRRSRTPLQSTFEKARRQGLERFHRTIHG